MTNEIDYHCAKHVAFNQMKDSVQKFSLNVLYISYVANPESGSESGSGWAILEYYLELNFKVSILCGPTTKKDIVSRLKDYPDQWEIISLNQSTFLDKLLNLLPIFPLQFRSLVWNLKILREWGKILSERKISFVHYATFAGDWNVCAPLFRSAINVLWGPVGGSQKVPKELIFSLGFMGLISESLRTLITSPFRQLNRLLVYLNKRVLVLSLNDAVQKVFSTDKRKSPLVSNIVLPCLTSKDFWCESESNYFFAAGRLIALKNWQLALRSLAILDDSSRLLIAGDGPQRRALGSMAKKLRIEDRVEFLGEVTHRECIDLMLASKGVVFPSLRDSEGWALAEAAHYGVPSIALDTPGSRAICNFAGLDLVPITKSNIVRDFASRMQNPNPPTNLAAFCKCRLRDRLFSLIPLE